MVWTCGNDWLKKCQQLVIEGKAGRGRGRKTWLKCVRGDMKELRRRVPSQLAYSGTWLQGSCLRFFMPGQDTRLIGKSPTRELAYSGSHLFGKFPSDRKVACRMLQVLHLFSTIYHSFINWFIIREKLLGAGSSLTGSI